MENSEAQASPNKLEVVQMFRVDTGGWVDLQGIVVVRRILEETVEWVEHFVRQQEEKFSVKKGLKHWQVECYETGRTLIDHHNLGHPRHRT